MESISKYGKVFTGKFAETAARLGIAKPVEEKKEVKPKVKTPVKPKVVKPKAVKKPKGDLTIKVSDQVKESVSTRKAKK